MQWHNEGDHHSMWFISNSRLFTVILVYCVQIVHRIHKIRLQKVTPVSPYWELHVVEENDPKEWLHMNSEWQIVTGETCKCNMVTWTAQYICGAIALG